MEIGRVIFYTGEIMFLCLFVFLSFYLFVFQPVCLFLTKPAASLREKRPVDACL